MNPEFPIHREVVDISQNIYAGHVRSYNQYFRNIMSWYEYCLYEDGISLSNFAMDPVDNPSTSGNLWKSGTPISHSPVLYIETYSCIIFL